jgi:flagellin-like protein
MSSKKALSPVIASIILSGMVLVVGGAVWSYSHGAASTMANDYADETIDMVHTIIERFNVEKVYYNSSTELVSIWFYNYGSVDITVDTTIKINETSYPEPDITITSKELGKIEIDVSEEPILPENQKITIQVTTERSNSEYETYYVR